MSYYVPSLKCELVKWLGDKYPKDRARFKAMSKVQLYAIYHSIRRDEG